MTSITNDTGIPLALAVWLVHDEYDYISEQNYISATGLMKPLRHIILPPRIPKAGAVIDVADFISRALGHSIHDSIEKAWQHCDTNLRKLGYPRNVVDRVLVNPTDADLDKAKDPIPVYLEQRGYRKITVDGKTYTIGGKFDAVTDGIVNDTKSTSAYGWMAADRPEEYQRQGSIYRWIDADGHSDIECSPESKYRPRITEDFIRINYVFTDWQKMQAKTNPGYPQQRVAQKEYVLSPIEDTEAWIIHKIRLIERFRNKPEKEIPECTPEELWQSEPSFKYYKDPTNTAGRSTRNFDDYAEAMRFQAEKGCGVIKTIPSEPKRCGYCPAFDGCSQKDKYQ